MPVPCRRLVPALALVAAAALATSHAHGQTAPPPELVTRALAAATGEARRALVEAHPELGREPAFTAVRQAAAAEGKAQDPGRAFNAYRVLMDATAAAGDDRRRIQMLLALGTLASQKGYVGLAEETLAEAAAYGERTGNPDIIIPAVNNLGITFLNQGRFDEARASYQRSYAAAEGAGRRDSMARSLNNIGDVATFQGDFRTALDYLTRSLALKETLGDEVAIARTSSNIGSIHLRQGSFDQALARFERALAVGQRLDNLQLQVGGAIDIALVRIAQGQPAAALTVLETARPLAERFGDPVLLGDLWQARGRASSQARRWSEARAALGTALTIQEASNNRAGQADTLLELAGLELRAGQPAAAVPHATRATELARSTGLAPGLWASYSLLGAAQASLGHPEEAAAAYTASIAEIERGRQQVAGGPEDARRFFQEKSTPYYELAAIRAAAGQAGEAFSLMERARARVLLDLIASGRPIIGALTPQQRARETALNTAIAAVAARLDAAADAERPALEAELAAARRAREEWTFETFGALPDLAFSRGEAPAVSPEEAVNALPASAVVLSFMTTADRTRLLVLSRTPTGTPAIRVAEIRATPADVARRADRFRRRIEQRDLGFATEARALYDLLVGPARAELRGSGPVIIVADGALWNLPFQALLSPRGRYLIEEHPVSYAPSVSALYRLQQRRQRRPRPGTGLLAIGDPSGTARPGGRLPNAAREVRALAAMYGAGSTVLTGAAATEAALRSGAATADVLHVATHGELVRSAPMYSFVALGGQTGATDPAVDGRLEAWEVANLPLAADLAVLSACESARGGDGGGEGVMGLSWSLFAAGASTAVVSLWKVDSASTTDLMLALHRSLVARRHGPAQPSTTGQVASAMRAAARALLATREYRHPFYWSGFVVAGAP